MVPICTMLPASLCRKNGTAASTIVTADITSTSKFRRHPSGVCGMPPRALAFDTITSMPPSRRADSSTHAASAGWSLASTDAPMTSPFGPSSLAARSTPSALRAQIATRMPSATSRSTTARPTPRLPPVTSAFLPASPRSTVGAPSLRELRPLRSPRRKWYDHAPVHGAAVQHVNGTGREPPPAGRAYVPVVLVPEVQGAVTLRALVELDEVPPAAAAVSVDLDQPGGHHLADPVILRA